MKAKVLHADGERTIALVFDPGDDPMQGLLEFAKRERLTAGHFTAIGAFEDVTLGYFDWSRKDYTRIAIREQVEVLSLVGDVAVEDGSPRSTPTSSWANATGRRTAAISSRPGCGPPWSSSWSSRRAICAGASTPGRSWP